MTSLRPSLRAGPLALAALTAAILRPVPADAGFVTEWNTMALDLIRSERLAPPVASRTLAMTQVAVFDAVNSVDRAYRPYRVQLDAAPGASREAATASAAHAVLRSLFPGQAAQLDAALASSLGPSPDREGSRCSRRPASSACSTSRWPTRRSPAGTRNTNTTCGGR